tara:strand:- start:5892 stop:6293 length:402 start_codon:yes stop_codon:yes gene_type:complete
MRILLSIYLLIISATFLAEDQKVLFKTGDILSPSSNSILVLYHYKIDAIQSERVKRFGSSSVFDLRDLSVDARDIYKLKRSDKFELSESLREGKIFKVKLLKKNPKRSSYYVVAESLRHYADLIVDKKLIKET